MGIVRIEVRQVRSFLREESTLLVYPLQSHGFMIESLSEIDYRLSI